MPSLGIIILSHSTLCSFPNQQLLESSKFKAFFGVIQIQSIRNADDKILGNSKEQILLLKR